MLGSRLVKSRCSTQSIVSLSSGEEGYYGLVKGWSMGLGIKSMLQDFGVNVNWVVKTDASAARESPIEKDWANCGQLWVQDRIARGDLTIEKINGEENVADNLTKHVSVEDIRVHMHRTNQEIIQGQHAIAPEDT